MLAARRSRGKEVIVSDGRKREEEDGHKCGRGAKEARLSIKGTESVVYRIKGRHKVH